MKHETTMVERQTVSVMRVHPRIEVRVTGRTIPDDHEAKAALALAEGRAA